MNDGQAETRHGTIARMAHLIWQMGAEVDGRALDHWLQAERVCESCPHCWERTMDGLPWFADKAVTVCPRCCKIVVYTNRLPGKPDSATELALKSDRWVGVMLNAFRKEPT